LQLEKGATVAAAAAQDGGGAQDGTFRDCLERERDGRWKMYMTGGPTLIVRVKELFNFKIIIFQMSNRSGV
jgi:hypothetical protein